MTALSLFDGMSCAQIAMEKAGHKINRYYASEIDEPAITVTQAEYPNTIQLGDVRNVHVTNNGIEVDESRSVMKQYGGVPDIIFAGSPCQDLSQAGKMKGLMDGERSSLFWELARIVKEAKKCNPKVKFLIEQVHTKKKWLRMITKELGAQPVRINSKYLSAQNRVRWYWQNFIPNESLQQVLILTDRGFTLADILEDQVDERYYLSDKAVDSMRGKLKAKFDPEKCYAVSTHNNAASFAGKRQNTVVTVHSGYGRTSKKKNGGSGPLLRNDGKVYAVNTTQSANRIEIIGGVINFGEFKANKANKANNIDANYFKGHDNHGARTVVQLNPSLESGGKQPYQQNIIFDPNGISPSVPAELSTGSYAIQEGQRFRRLTPVEVERLQGVPDNYTNHVSDAQRYKMLGNGWQIDTIVHILKHLKKSPKGLDS